MASRSHGGLVKTPAPSLVLRFNGDRSSDKIVVHAIRSRAAIARRANEQAHAVGWGYVLVGRAAELERIGAYRNQYGGWIWRSLRGCEIAVECVDDCGCVTESAS
jgi:hypothetical protein